ncbi:hypothetical protein BLA29_015138 [Euroglyphus maynei]|uniref:Uncharacterized protein n=1 Tax=Euroglyphus maynei TaxID=6958 RepID=A0A1Y3AP53_EURMA|nr:hypothetical protein BLA29_015138 [Euroglyphus maynei]
MTATDLRSRSKSSITGGGDHKPGKAPEYDSETIWSINDCNMYKIFTNTSILFHRSRSSS